jgi:phosphoglucomutase
MNTGNRPTPLLQPFPSKEQINDAMATLILSASGWRKVFAGSGDEESRSASLLIADQVITTGMALAFGRTLIERQGKTDIIAAVATDSRPTGPLMADIAIRVLLSLGIAVKYSGVTATPELLAAVQRKDKIYGFCYLSASHNPVGHNGVKFGFEDGSVAGGEESKSLISLFKSIMSTAYEGEFENAVFGCDPQALADVYDCIPGWKASTYSCYLSFASAVAAGSDESKKIDDLFALLQKSSKEFPLSVVAELNGSARGSSIDTEILGLAGVGTRVENGVPGQIMHRIVPEGESLDPCRRLLEESAAKESSFFAGYVPDNDGDRGNLVYWDRETHAASPLQAQEVFALSCLSELAYLSRMNMQSGGNGELPNTAVAVNGPTSLRIDAIASAFGAGVFRAEVGEANVVNLARKLRSEGKIVRILGEGSNGGNITHPAACRDPINTLLSVIKLMLLRSDSEYPGLFQIWWNKSTQSKAFPKNFTLPDIIASLPEFATTSAFEDRAIMRIASRDHGKLKEAYESLFLDEWSTIQKYLSSKLGVFSWEIENHEGIETKIGIGNRDTSGPQTGGLKVLFRDSGGSAKAYIWMRGSGTEPVFRVLADVQGNRPDLEEYLLHWHKELIRRADHLAAR